MSRSRRSHILSLAGALVLTLAPAALATQCPQPPPPDQFGQICPWGGGIGVRITVDPGFSVDGLGFTPNTPDIAHVYETWADNIKLDAYLDGRIVHAGSYRGGCDITIADATRCTTSTLAAINSFLMTCALDDPSNADGVKVCANKPDTTGAYLRFYVNYTLKAGPSRQLNGSHVLFHAAGSGISPLHYEPPSPAAGTKSVLIPGGKTTKWFPNGDYNIRFTVENTGCIGANGRTVGETENYTLGVHDSKATLKARGSSIEIPAVTCP